MLAVPRPSSSIVVEPACSFWNMVDSFSVRCAAASKHASKSLARTTTTPSASPTSQSPGRTTASPITTGFPTDPGPCLPAPGMAVPRAKTGNSRRSMASMSRTVASMTRPVTPADTAATGQDLPPITASNVARDRHGQHRAGG